MSAALTEGSRRTSGWARRTATVSDMCTSAPFARNVCSVQGRAKPWRICVLDLLVTLPRMHLERIMKPTNTTTVVSL